MSEAETPPANMANEAQKLIDNGWTIIMLTGS